MNFFIIFDILRIMPVQISVRLRHKGDKAQCKRKCPFLHPYFFSQSRRAAAMTTAVGLIRKNAQGGAHTRRKHRSPRISCCHNSIKNDKRNLLCVFAGTEKQQPPLPSLCDVIKKFPACLLSYLLAVNKSNPRCCCSRAHLYKYREIRYARDVYIYYISGAQSVSQRIYIIQYWRSRNYYHQPEQRELLRTSRSFDNNCVCTRAADFNFNLCRAH